MFGSFGAGFGTFGGGVGGVLPALTNLTSWLKAPTQDGTTLVNSKGVDAELTDVNCLSFDGSNDYVDTGIPLTEDISFEATFKPNYTNHGKRCGTAIDGNNRLYFEFVNTSGNNIKAVIGASGNSIQIPESEAPEGVFGTIRLYPNGDVYWNGVNKGNTGGDVTGTGTNTIFIGAFNSGGVDINNQDTEYSEFKVYENGELVQHLPLAEGSGTKVYDISGNGNHGTISDATWTTEDGIESWNHEYGFDVSAVFDGSDDYVDTGISATDEYTFEVTAKLNADSDYQGYFQANERFFFGRNSSNTLRLGYITFNSTAIISSSIYDKFTTYKIEGGKLFVDGVEVIDSGVTPSGATLGNLYIGARNAVALSTVDSFVNQEFKNAKIYDNNGILVRDFVPSEDGLYDKVNGVYYSNDGTGTITTKRIPALNTKTKQVATFDGVDDYVLTEPVTLGSNFEFEWTGSLSGGESFGAVFANNNTSVVENAFFLSRNVLTDNLLFTLVPVNGVRQLSPNVSFDFDGSVKTHKVTYNNGELIYVVDDIELLNHSFDNADGFTNSNSFGLYAKTNGDNNSSGTLQNFKLTISGSTAFEYDFQNDIGTTTVQDLTANDNDGTGSIGTADINTGAGGLAEFWGTRVADNDGVLVSADYATGNTSISNPAGFVHNNSECGVKLQSQTVGTFDGAADQVNTNYQPTGDFVVDARIKLDTVTGQKVIHACGTGDGNSGYWFRISNGHWQIYAAGGYAIISTVLLQPVVDTIYDTRVEYTASSNTWVLKVKLHTDSTYTTVGSGTTSTPDFSTANVVLGQKGGIQFFDGEYYSFKLTDGGVDKVEYNFSEAQGTTTTDLSGNGNNGTITVGSGGTETFWADSYREYSASNLFSHTNGTNNTWVKESGSNITQIGQYDEDETLTSNEDTRNDRYFG